MDWPIKETLLMNGNDDIGDGRIFCGINSYNIGRPLMQMVHFVSVVCCYDQKAQLQILFLISDTAIWVVTYSLDLDLLENGGAISDQTR